MAIRSCMVLFNLKVGWLQKVIWSWRNYRSRVSVGTNLLGQMEATRMVLGKV